MEARDGDRKIKPLPPEISHDAPKAARTRSRRGMAVGIVAAILVALGALTQLGGGSAEGPDTATTTTIAGLATGALPEDTTTTATTTTTRPPTLSQRIPGYTGLLAVASADRNRGFMTIWGASEHESITAGLATRPDMMAFDPSGTWVAYLNFFRETAALHVGVRTAAQPVQFVGVTSVLWHPTEPLRLAWTAKLPADGRFVLIEGTVNPATGELVIGREVADLTGAGDEGRLVGWGDWGYAIEIVQGTSAPLEDGTGISVLTMLILLDSEGGPVLSAPVSFRGASPDGLLLVRSERVAYEAILAIPDVDLFTLGLFPATFVDVPLTGAFLTDSTMVPNITQPPLDHNAQLRLHPRGTHVSQVVESVNGGTNVTTFDVEARGTRITSLRGSLRLLDFTPDGKYLVFDDDSGIVLVDWNNGASFEVPLPGDNIISVWLE